MFTDNNKETNDILKSVDRIDSIKKICLKSPYLSTEEKAGIELSVNMFLEKESLLDEHEKEFLVNSFVVMQALKRGLHESNLNCLNLTLKNILGQYYISTKGQNNVCINSVFSDESPEIIVGQAIENTVVVLEKFFLKDNLKRKELNFFLDGIEDIIKSLIGTISDTLDKKIKDIKKALNHFDFLKKTITKSDFKSFKNSVNFKKFNDYMANDDYQFMPNTSYSKMINENLYFRLLQEDKLTKENNYYTLKTILDNTTENNSIAEYFVILKSALRLHRERNF